LFRGRGHRSLPLVRRAALTVVQVVLLVVAVSLTKKVSGPVFQLNKVAQLNSGLSSSITYHSSLLAYPQDLYYVVFDPLPITAHGASQFVAALENSVIVVLILTSLRRLRALPRFMVTRPYVMVATLFCAAFVYSFAALGNLGLIDRERVVMLPFLLVLLSLPVAERAPRAKRARRRGARRTYAGPLGTAWAPSGDPVLDNLLGSAGLPGAPSLEPPP